MPIPEKYLADFEEHGIYHVYNRTNNNEKLFLNDANRSFFLEKYKHHLSPYVDTYCWCLLPNHFHFLLRIKPIETIVESIHAKPASDRSITENKLIMQQCTLSEFIEQAFKRFFQSYSLAFNKVHRRKGNLFYRPFKRVMVEKKSHFTSAVVYIHANPLRHQLTKNFTTYKWSSWKSYISDAPSQLLRQEVLDWFGCKEQFIKAHHDLTQHYHDSNVSIED